MSTVGTLSVRIVGDNSDLTKKLGVSTKAVAAFGAAAVTAAVAATAALVRAGLQSADAQVKLARSLDGTITGLQALDRAANRAGVSSGELESALTRLNQNLGRAMSEGGPAADALERLGLNARELAGMDVDERMAAIADQIKAMGLNSQETAAILRDLGIRQASVVNLMREGGDAIRESKDRLAEYGLTMNNIDARKIEAANDAMGEFSVIMDGVTQKLAAKFAPAIELIATKFADAAAEGEGIGAGVDKAYEMIKTSAIFIINAIDGVARTFEVAGKVGAAFALGLSKAFLELANAIVNGPIYAVNELIKLMNKIPMLEIGEIGLTNFGEEIATQLRIVDEALRFAGEDIQDTLLRPLAGDQFRILLDEAEANAEQMAMFAEETFVSSLGRQEEFQEASKGSAQAYQDDLAQIEQDAANARMQAAQIEYDAKRSMIGASINLLGEFANKSKAAAIAQIALSKAFAIGEIIRNTAIAQMKALAVLGPIAGPPMAAKIGAYGKIQAGIVAATGLVQAANAMRGDGGTGIGTTTSAGTTQQAVSAPTAATGTTSGQVVQIALQGEIFGREQVRNLISQINESIADGAVLRLA